MQHNGGGMVVGLAEWRITEYGRQCTATHLHSVQSPSYEPPWLNASGASQHQERKQGERKVANEWGLI